MHEDPSRFGVGTRACPANRPGEFGGPGVPKISLLDCYLAWSRRWGGRRAATDHAGLGGSAQQPRVRIRFPGWGQVIHPLVRRCRRVHLGPNRDQPNPLNALRNHLQGSPPLRPCSSRRQEPPRQPPTRPPLAAANQRTAAERARIVAPPPPRPPQSVEPETPPVFAAAVRRTTDRPTDRPTMCNVPRRTPSMAAMARAWKNEKYVRRGGRTALFGAGRCHRIITN